MLLVEDDLVVQGPTEISPNVVDGHGSGGELLDGLLVQLLLVLGPTGVYSVSVLEPDARSDQGNQVWRVD